MRKICTLCCIWRELDPRAASLTSGTNTVPCFLVAALFCRGSGSGKRGAQGFGQAQRHVVVARVRPRSASSSSRVRNSASAQLRSPVPPAGVAASARSRQPLRSFSANISKLVDFILQEQTPLTLVRTASSNAGQSRSLYRTAHTSTGSIKENKRIDDGWLPLTAAEHRRPAS